MIKSQKQIQTHISQASQLVYFFKDLHSYFFQLFCTFLVLILVFGCICLLYILLFSYFFRLVLVMLYNL
jgi:hypothetical protein